MNGDKIGDDLICVKNAINVDTLILGQNFDFDLNKYLNGSIDDLRFSNNGKLLNLNCSMTNSCMEYQFNGNMFHTEGTFTHGSLFGTASVSSNSLVIEDNIDGHATIPVSIVNGLYDFSISLKVKFNRLHTTGSYPTNSIFQGTRANEMNPFALGYESVSNHFRFVLEDNNYDFPFSASPETWYCINIKRVFDKVYLSINGSEITSGINCVTSSISVDTLILGQEQDCVSGCFAANQSLAGEIDDLKICNFNSINSCIPTSQNERFVTKDIKIYPNPVKDNLIIEKTEAIQFIEIHDILGKVIISTNYTNVIDLSEINNGLYFIVLKDKEQQIVQKEKIIKY